MVAKRQHVLEALSHGLDLVEGQPLGHSLRTAIIAGCIAKRLGLSTAEMVDIHYVAILKDTGCSTNAARIQQIFCGDDLILKQRTKLIDWTNPIATARYALKNCAEGGSLSDRIKHLRYLAEHSQEVKIGLVQARCTRGHDIAIELGLGKAVADSVKSLDEHWNGRGAPSGLKGEEIPVASRIVGLAQTLEVFAATYGVAPAFEMVRSRSGRWFWPEAAEASQELEWQYDLWDWHQTHLCQPACPLPLKHSINDPTPANFGNICEVFATIIDAKSAFTGDHSTRVAQYSRALAKHIGLDDLACERVTQAAYLHDLGKLGVSNQILDKNGALNGGEFRSVQDHPRLTYQILRRINGFEQVAEIAGSHHEKLDGSGYWRGLTATQINAETRVLVVADMFDALTADRPYRSGLPTEDAITLLTSEAGTKLDANCVAGIAELYAAEPVELAAA